MIEYGLTVAHGCRIVENPLLTVTVEDWSKVRSPSRARRRLKRGFKQNVIYRLTPDPKGYYLDGGRVLVMHPEIVRELERHFAAQLEKMMADTIMGRR